MGVGLIRRLSLTAKLSLLFAGFTLTVAALLGTYAYYQLADDIDAHDNLDLILTARHARRLASEMASVDELTRHADRISSLIYSSDEFSIRILHDGKVLESYAIVPSLKEVDLPHRLDSPVAVNQSITNAAIISWKAADGHVVRDVSADTSLRDGSVVRIVVKRDMFDRGLSLDHYRDRLKLAGAVGLVLSFLLSYLFMRKSLAPLRVLARITGNVTLNNMDHRIDVSDAPPELENLIRSINAMLARLDAGYQRLSQYTTDLAHDMRTPLSNMRGATEVALSRARDVAEYQTVLASNLEECDRLSRMIENTLFLGRAENPQFITQTRPFDVCEEVHHIAAYFEDLADDKGVALSVTARPGQLSADIEMFRRALSNLLVNAVRHTPQGGRIWIEVKDQASAISITVANSGSVIPADQLERIFDRFYRIDPSRHVSDAALGHSGLGLAIVRTVMDLHRGHVHAESDAQSTRFVLTFPYSQDHV